MIIDEFVNLKLHPQLLQRVADLGYINPTPIQSAVIPVMLSGRDVIGQAQTGTGKTAAFSLPILHNLIKGQGHVQSLVVTPTRELAMQVADAMYKYGGNLNVRVLAVYGGQPYIRQINCLKKGVDIVVGTPGRLLDLVRQKALDLGRVSSVVLDEADEMLSMGFIEEIESILRETSAHHQTALFSATMPQKIKRLAGRYMREPSSFSIGNKQITLAAIEQRYYQVNEAGKLAALTRLLEVGQITSALIFARTRLETGSLANELSLRGFSAEALNGDMSQDARERVLNLFRKNRIRVLVATDVAARGLDIDDISHVINYDLPRDPELYVHRIGRTGRAGKTGIAVSLLVPKDRRRLSMIEAYTNQKITRSVLPTVEDIHLYRDTLLMEQMAVWLKRGRCRREQELVKKLLEGGHELEEIAAVALKLARAEEKQRPVEPIGEAQDVRPEKTIESGKTGEKDSRRGWSAGSHEKGMVRLIFNTGKSGGTNVNHIVGTIAHFADIPGDSIGRILIQEKKTYVDVPEQFMGQVLAKTGAYRIRKQRITVERA
ncbi:MAG: DEAD/DEAH box helicase [Proteobacteria bacterium]|nr:DEAD/DEAH box helicase [Pseudomonadota bacterium]